GIPALHAEVESAARALALPAARLLAHQRECAVTLEEVEQVLASDALVIDACRHAVRAGTTFIPLTSRPVLFTLLRALGEAWPGDVPRAGLVARAFRARAAEESCRVGLRVELGRLRRLLRPLAAIAATRQGFVLVPHGGRELALLLRPVEDAHADVLALLTDG